VKVYGPDVNVCADRLIEYSFSVAVTAVPATAADELPVPAEELPVPAEELAVPADADVVPAPPPPPLDEQPARNAAALTIADTETALITNPAMTKLPVSRSRYAPAIRADSIAIAYRERDRPARSPGSSSRRIDPWG
jgi:hypothetical protein